MKEKLQTKFATRQYMISDTFELYYYSTDDVPGVKEHTHTHYEFYLFLEGAISLEIDGVLYTPTPGDLLLIPPGVPHHLVMHDLSVPYRRFVFWVSAAFAEQLRARSADYVYLMEYAAENQKYLFPLDSVEFNTIQYRTIRLIEEMRSDHFGKETQIFLYVSDLLMQINRTVYEQHHPLTRKAQLSLYEQLCFYIDEHLSEDLSLERLAAELFVKSACRSTSTFPKSGWQGAVKRCSAMYRSRRCICCSDFTTIRVFTARLKKSTGSRRRILKNCIPLPAINTVVPNALFTLYFSGGFLICFRCGEN